MSGGGGGIIIITNLIDNPSTTAEEKSRLREIEFRLRTQGFVGVFDRWTVASIVKRLLNK